jgi:hypothetical protein
MDIKQVLARFTLAELESRAKSRAATPLTVGALLASFMIGAPVALAQPEPNPGAKKEVKKAKKKAEKSCGGAKKEKRAQPH